MCVRAKFVINKLKCQNKLLEVEMKELKAKIERESDKVNELKIELKATCNEVTLLKRKCIVFVVLCYFNVCVYFNSVYMKFE